MIKTKLSIFTIWQRSLKAFPIVPFFPGNTYEHPCTAVLAGSGGGKSFASGGGVIYVSVEKIIELDGWIKADGKSGDSGGGGASGGTMWVAARHFEGDNKNVII